MRGTLEVDQDERIAWAQFRFSVIAPLVCRKIESEEHRRALRREILEQIYVSPDGHEKRIHRRTLQQWLYLHKKHGFEGLLDSHRSTRGTCRAISKEILDRAELLRRQEPARSVRTILSILRAQGFDVATVSRSTLNSHLNLRGASKQKLASQKGAFQRWEQKYVNVLWQADTSHGVWLPDPTNPKKVKKTKLISFIDDASRVCTHAEFYWDEKLPSLVDCFRKALLKRGKPEKMLCDNAFIYHSNTFNLMCAQLKIETHYCTAYSPEGKGKVEKHYGTIKSSFYVEAEHAGLTNLADLNQFFWAWLTKEYHHSKHSSLDMTPIERWARDEYRVQRVTPEDIRRALMLRAERKVNVRTAMIRIDNQWYQADPSLAGSIVEIRWQAGSRDQIELWKDQTYIGSAHSTMPGTSIDFERKAERARPKNRGITFESSKTYRLSLVNEHRGEAPLPATPADDYLAETEFVNVLEILLERTLLDEEKDFVSQFFLQCSPLKSRKTTTLLEQAVNAKGTRMHLRFYLEHIRRLTFQKRK
jgi:putative transposase